MEDMEKMFKELYETNVTKTSHRGLYPALSPSRPEMNQARRVILIPGGGTTIGFAIARAFVRASADTVIIVGRRAEVLAKAASALEQEAKAGGTTTKIISRPCDVFNQGESEKLWTYLAAQGIVVDVFVANVAKFTEPKPILELGLDEVWSQFEANAKFPLFFTEKFYSQPGEKQKFLVNVSTQAVHMTGHPGVAVRPAYSLSKMAGTMMFQAVAQNTPPEKMQIVSFHPGIIYNDVWKAMDLLPPERFDDDELCGAFAVWATTKEAKFLHGRFVWAAWDIEELATGEVRKRIDEDPYYLRASIVGLNNGMKA